MTVLDLIKELLDCPMNAKVSFVGEITDPNNNEAEAFDIDFDIGNVRVGSPRYVELSA